MRAKTHQVLVVNFLKEYTKYSRSKIFEMISGMNIEDTLNVETFFGAVEITYIGKEINNCNRYNKYKKGFQSIFDEKNTYKLRVYIN